MEKLKAAVDAAEEEEASKQEPGNPPLAEPDLKKSSEWSILRRKPLLVVAPTLLAIVITALCVFGVTYAIEIRIETNRELAQAAARDAADALQLQLSVVGGAALQLATLVQANPDWTWLEEKFPVVAEEIFRQNNKSSNYELAELLYAPFGKISANYAPPDRFRGPVTSDLFAGDFLEILRPFVMVQLGSMTINGPVPLSTGGGVVVAAGYPIFIKNVSRAEDFNNPFNRTAPTGCEELCYDEATRTKFWGFSGAYIFADDIISGEDEHLSNLIKDGYQYSISSVRFSDLTKANVSQEKHLIAKSDGWKDDQEPTAAVDVGLPGVTDWHLAVYTEETEKLLNVRDGLIAMIVIIAFLLAGLLSLLLISMKKARILLDDQLVTNAKLESANCHLASTKAILEAEKQQREALLGRQYDLISCFERKGTSVIERSSMRSTTSSMADRQHATLEQIAALRRTMDEERSKCSTSPHDDLQFFELLGEGSFGKVHRGSWRCTECAIKTMMLPANMSGAEKREKMVVWEAAISSSLAHPNIVSTFNYSIKPVREHAREKHMSGQKSFGSMSRFDLGSAVICGDAQSLKDSSTAEIKSEQSCEGGAIHSFEVSLVLELCDQGSLRDALDQGSFMSGDKGLNYAAVLDSATDIARAMLHLHCNNVLHMDLKARNILLASSGTLGGRGLTCKVSDFGLAVRMEQTETHLSGFCQGTLTHIAPETLLDGQISKAADVYAFGILLWELFTSGQPYKGVPKALLGHKVCAEGCRPTIPLAMPRGYRELVEACWARTPADRPSFAEILERLQGLRSGVPGPTPPLGPLAKPTPKLPTVNKARTRSLPALSEHSSHSLSATVIQMKNADSTAQPPAHSVHSLEHQACQLDGNSEQHPPGHQPNGTHTSQQALSSTGARRGSLDNCAARPCKIVWGGLASSGPEWSHGARAAADGAVSGSCTGSGDAHTAAGWAVSGSRRGSRDARAAADGAERGPLPDSKQNQKSDNQSQNSNNQNHNSDNQNSGSTWLPLAPDLASAPADCTPRLQIMKGGPQQPETRAAVAESNSPISSAAAGPSVMSVRCHSSSGGSSSSTPPRRHTMLRSTSDTPPGRSNRPKHSAASAGSHSCIILIGDGDNTGTYFKASLEGPLSPIEELHESQNSCLGDQSS